MTKATWIPVVIHDRSNVYHTPRRDEPWTSCGQQINTGWLLRWRWQAVSYHEAESCKRCFPE